MSHTIKLIVEVELTRTQGKFATRDEMVEGLTDILENAEDSLYGIGPDGDTDYEVDSWSVEEDTSDATIKQLRGRIRDLERIIVARDKRIASRDREIIKLSHGE